ncbi:hypothetical protein LVJ94_30975 [Pendulispora rubella]|uniref:Transporter n=1 Tax=Pendulispora rubella TaxID=2741070 RepID=A0ABZ2KRP1_9BACT
MRRSRPPSFHVFRSVVPSLLASSVALASYEAAAAPSSCDNPQTNTCINAETLWPNPGPSRFVGVGGTETVAPAHLGFGLLASYLSRPIVLHLPSPAPTGTDVNALDNQINANFLFAYGITKQLELDLALPLTLIQSGSGISGLTAGDRLHSTAMRDLRFGFAYAILPRLEPEQPFALTARLVVSAPTGDSDQFARDKSAVFAPSLAADYRRGKFFAGLELGARIRETSEFVGGRVGTQGYAALGFGFDILRNDLLSVTGEARVLPIFPEQHDLVQDGAFLRSEPNGKHLVPAEWTAGVRSAPFEKTDVAFQVSGGGAIPFNDPVAMTTPRFRFTLGVVYAPRTHSAPVTSPPVAHP